MIRALSELHDVHPIARAIEMFQWRLMRQNASYILLYNTNSYQCYSNRQHMQLRPLTLAVCSFLVQHVDHEIIP